MASDRDESRAKLKIIFDSKTGKIPFDINILFIITIFTIIIFKKLPKKVLK